MLSFDHSSNYTPPYANSSVQNFLNRGISDVGGVWLPSVHAYCFRLQCSKGLRLARPFSKQDWQHFFTDPSEWWEHRFEKANTRYPDFKHKKTQKSLWIDGVSTPQWVKAELHSLPPGPVKQTVFSWTAKITRCVKDRKYMKALECFQCMEGLSPDTYTFGLILKACAGLGFLEEGRRVHAQAIRCACHLDVFVGSCLIDMYAKCKSIEDACNVFDNLPVHNVVSWSTMITGYVKCGHGEKALDLFKQMQQEQFMPNGFTFVGALNACASVAALADGRRLHAAIIQSGFSSNIFVASGLVDMYAKCNSIEDACKVFDDLSEPNTVTWNALIKGYTNCKQEDKALQLFQKMQVEQVKPDAFTFSGVLNACSSLGALDEGRLVHACIIRNGMLSDLFVGNCLIDMYIRCRSIEDAYRVFSNMQVRDVVSWTAMIAGYENCGQREVALNLFQQMLQYEINPNSATFVSVLSACASVAALMEGRHVHAQAIQRGYGSYLAVQNCLIDMYAKCGSIQDAYRVFKNMLEHDIVSWNAMIMGYGIHGLCKEALQIFDDMCKCDVQVDSGTFVSLLSVFSHTGLVDHGCYYFESMSAVYDISSIVQHYSCFVVILGRSGHIQEALDIIRDMWCQPDSCVWIALLGACRIHDNVQVGEYAAQKISDFYTEDLDQMDQVLGYTWANNIDLASV